MARVHRVERAAKDYPQAGIKKGESYYWWQLYKQRKQMSKTVPKRSQLTGSEYQQRLFSIIEDLEAWQGDWTEVDRDDLVAQLEELRDETQKKYDNLPEGLQQGDTGVLLEERVSNLDGWIDELNSIDFPEEEGERDEDAESPYDLALASIPDV